MTQSPVAIELLGDQAAIDDPLAPGAADRAIARHRGGPVPDELPQGTDVDLKHALLNGARIEDRLVNAVVDGTLTRTMEGSSTLELDVFDPFREIVHTNVLKGFLRDDHHGIFMRLDGRDYALAQVDKKGDIFTLTFENRAVFELKRHGKDRPIKAFRDKVTRAEFILAMVRGMGNYHVHFYSPELHTVQPIKNKHTKVRQKTREKTRHPGVSSDAGITVKHQRASATQLRYINEVLDVGTSMHAPYPVQVAAIETITQESDISNLVGHGGVDVGLFSQNSAYWPASRDVSRDARAFYEKAIAAYKQNPHMATWDIAQAVQASGAGASYYREWQSEAIHTVKAYGSGSVAGGSFTEERFKRYAFQRKKGESDWDAMSRLASEVRWRLFMVDDTLYYVDDNTLLKSAARMHVREVRPGKDTPDKKAQGIDMIDYTLDYAKSVQELTVYCRAARWNAPPGTVVVIEDTGPANGPWLVHEIRRSIFDDNAEITCRLPQPPKEEPAPDTERVKVKVGSADSASGGLTGNAQLNRAYEAARAISRRHLPYTWGGGHNSSFAPGPGYDCSGYVSAVLHAAGWLDSPLVSGALEGWGRPGVGQVMTVWANAGHTFMEFHMPGRSIEHYGTGRWGTSLSGPGFKPSLHPHGGFVARHWPGT